MSSSNEFATAMRILSIIDTINMENKYPDLPELTKAFDAFRTHIDYICQVLLGKGYIEKADYSEFYTYGYKLTTSGKDALEDYKSKSKEFCGNAMVMCRGGDRQSLYEYISANRNFFWFSIYEGSLTKENINEITSLLEMDSKSLWWDSRDEWTADLWNRGYGTG
jgi:hypothetical protein